MYNPKTFSPHAKAVYHKAADRLKGVDDRSRTAILNGIQAASTVPDTMSSTVPDTMLMTNIQFGINDSTPFCSQENTGWIGGYDPDEIKNIPLEDHDRRALNDCMRIFSILSVDERSAVIGSLHNRFADLFYNQLGIIGLDSDVNLSDEEGSGSFVA